ncbi:hypothetical protein E5P55_00205 [Candidatus Pinguicoccus supinus]|uniref:RNA polymerase sigma factor 54 DNA-binding domain-containing protein n=1 Tax=Candidatus Pinguicoccus supinus TaxID=2529394 RepID=A0A7T0BRI3_9BACT|nr:hypothetical protein E5P55_00205 [Candidatus Pinguicoccus supinus]
MDSFLKIKVNSEVRTKLNTSTKLIVQNSIFFKLSFNETFIFIKKLLYKYIKIKSLKFFTYKFLTDKLYDNYNYNLSIINSIEIYNINIKFFFKSTFDFLKKNNCFFKPKIFRYFKFIYRQYLNKFIMNNALVYNSEVFADILCFDVCKFKVHIYFIKLLEGLKIFLNKHKTTVKIFKKLNQMLVNKGKFLFKLINIIFSYQKEFFLKKKFFLIRKIKTNCIKKYLNVSESTLSRLLNNKYIYIKGLGFHKLILLVGKYPKKKLLIT